MIKNREKQKMITSEKLEHTDLINRFIKIVADSFSFDRLIDLLTLFKLYLPHMLTEKEMQRKQEPVDHNVAPQSFSLTAFTLPTHENSNFYVKFKHKRSLKMVFKHISDARCELQSVNLKILT